DPVFDAFLTGSSTFGELPDVVQRLSDGSLDALCHVIEYPVAANPSIGHRASDSTPTEAPR
ncbi:MAG: dehydrogenase, partial [Arthrobacter sp.]|nr:dehydrogenase [Arthrobacter sp.]